MFLWSMSLGLWIGGAVTFFMGQQGEWAAGISFFVLAILITLWAILITLRDILDQMKR
jgi:hypothetical protein